MRSASLVGPLALVAFTAVAGGVSLSCSGERDSRETRGSVDRHDDVFTVEADGALALRVGRDIARVRTRAIERGGARVRAVERVVPHGDGVEQTWTFDRAPPGDGVLVVRVAVDDLTFVGTAACGARYRSERTGNGLCYGRATWVDAHGERTPVPWSIDRHGIAMRVAADVLEGSTYPTVLDPVIGPEIEVGDFAWGIGNQHVSGFGAASGPEGALFVWTTVSPWGIDSLPGVARALVLGPGLPIGAPIELGDASPFADVRVGFGGGVFRVFSTTQEETRMIRLDPTGTVLDPGGGVMVDVGAVSSHAVACLPDGRCALALQGNVAVVDADGSILADVALPELVSGSQLTASSTGWITVGEPGVTIVGIDADTLSASDPVELDAGGGGWGRDVVSRGDVTIVTWCRPDGMRWSTLDGALERIHPDGLIAGFYGHGAVPTEAGFVVAGLGGRVIEVDPAVGPVRETSGALDSWLEPEGVRIDGTAAVWLTGVKVDPARDFLGEPPTAMLGTQVDLTTLTVESTTTLTPGPVVQVAPTAAGGPAGHAVAFRDYRDDVRRGHDRVRFFDAEDEPLPGPSIRLGSAPGSDVPPQVVRQGNHFVAAWMEEDKAVRVRRFAADGTSLDPAPVVVRTDRWGRLAMAATDDAIVVASSGFAGSFVDVLAGEVLAVVDAIELDASFAWLDMDDVDGEIWLVGTDGNDRVLRRFDASGAALDEGTSVEPFLAMWGDWFGCADRCYVSSVAPGNDFVVRELHADGTTSPDILSSPRGSTSFGSDGARAVVTGSEWVTVGSTNAVMLDVTWIEAGRIVDHAEAVPASSTINGFTNQDWPSIAPLPQGGSIVVYEDHEAGRLRARTLVAEPSPTPGEGGGGAGGSTASSTAIGSGGGGGAGADGGGAPQATSSTSGDPGAGGSGAPSTASSGGPSSTGGAAPLDEPTGAGCSCDVPRSRSRTASPLAAMIALAALLARRRRAA